MIQWSLLRERKAGDAFKVPQDGLSLIEEGVYKISDTQYCLADAVIEGEHNRLTLLSFYWAASEGAFRRAYFRDVEADDLRSAGGVVARRRGCNVRRNKACAGVGLDGDGTCILSSDV